MKPFLTCLIPVIFFIGITTLWSRFFRRGYQATITLDHTTCLQQQDGTLLFKRLPTYGNFILTFLTLGILVSLVTTLDLIVKSAPTHIAAQNASLLIICIVLILATYKFLTRMPSKYTRVTADGIEMVSKKRSRHIPVSDLTQVIVETKFVKTGGSQYAIEVVLNDKTTIELGKKSEWSPNQANKVADLVSEVTGVERRQQWQAQETKTLDKPATPTSKPPWNPSYFNLLAFFFSFGAAGIVAGINWPRLGKPERMIPTIGLTIAGMIAYIMFIFFIAIPAEISDLILFLVNLGIGYVLVRSQIPAYQEYVQTYGETSNKQAGYALPVVIGLGTLGAIVAFFIIISLFSLGGMEMIEANQHYAQGITYYENGQLELALEEYNQAIALDPDFEEAYINRGVTHMELANLTRQPNSISIPPVAIEIRGVNNYQQAIDDFSEALRLNPRSVRSYINRGTAYSFSGHHSLALDDYDQAIELAPADPDGYFLRGVFYASTRNEAQSIADLEKAIELGLEAEVEQYAIEILNDMK